jgi:hypothetical protein
VLQDPRVYSLVALTPLAHLQGRTLMALLEAFYLDPLNFLHVHKFNREPAAFDYTALLKELGHQLPS